MLWWFPVAVVLVGTLVVALYLRERTGRGVTRNAFDDDAELEALARDALGSSTSDRTARP
jgi:cytochrome c-type biogenesis protein CcmH/NrfF